MKKLRTLSFQFLFLTSIAIVSCSDDKEPSKKTIPTDGLIAEYLFNGNAEDTKNDLNGVVTGATLTTDRHDKANAAYNFDGNDYISIVDDGTLNFTSTQDFTISLWVSANEAQNDDAPINDILRKWVGDAQGYPYSISYLNSTSADHSKEILMVRYDSQGCGDAPTMYSDAISNGEFVHIVYMKQAGVLSLMINGDVITQTDDTTVTTETCDTSNNSHVTIGTRGQLARYFSGKIDDLRFYNRALTSEEIGQLYAE